MIRAEMCRAGNLFGKFPLLVPVLARKITPVIAKGTPYAKRETQGQHR